MGHATLKNSKNKTQQQQKTMGAINSQENLNKYTSCEVYHLLTTITLFYDHFTVSQKGLGAKVTF